MKIDNYSKAIGIIYATSRMMHPLDEGLDSVALKMYNEALGLLEKGNYPEPAAVMAPAEAPSGDINTVTLPFRKEYTPYKNASNTSDYRMVHGVTTTISSSGAEPEPVSTVEESSAAQEPEPVKESPKAASNVWGHGEDSYIRVSASADEAVCNRPLGSHKTDTQVKNKWYYLKQRKMLLSKGDRVWYQGDNENLCQKFTPAGRGAILGSISAITDDKTSATVFFDGDKSAYQIPICDIIRAGEA